jgi:FKBP-type peptidyl-prolyl cis-trans isomerase SlpA
MSIPIDTGTTVTLHFALALEDGAVVDSNFEGKPATFSIGDGSLLPGFEETLFGLRATDEQEFLVPPEKAFGQHNEQNVQAVAMVILMLWKLKSVPCSRFRTVTVSCQV